ncbi:MAG: hypothetical protein WC201_02450 [Bacilli bacterium]
MTKEKYKMPRWSKIVIGIAGSLVAFLLFAWASLSVSKYFIYDDFYRVRQEVGHIPGLNSGTTPQGLAYSTTEDVYLVSSYSDEGSYLYATGPGVDKTIALPLYQNGEAFTGHVGGVATSGPNVYLADGGHIYFLSLGDEVLRNVNGRIDIGTGYEVNNSASFVFANDDYLYVGEFHDAKHHYVCNHSYENNNAIVAQYALSDFDDYDYDGNDLITPLMNISIRDQVQGFAIKDDGTIVLSTSYGIASSRFFIYDSSCLVDTGESLYGASLYTLSLSTSSLEAPPMMEDLDIKDNRIIVFTESACNKYVFGKLFFADKILSLGI